MARRRQIAQNDSAVPPCETDPEKEQLRQQWLTDYRPDFPTFEQVVLRAAEADWALRREEQRSLGVEQAILRDHEDPLFWTDEHHKLLERFARRRTAAERSLHQWRNAAEQIRRTRMMETIRLEQHSWKRAALANTEKPARGRQKESEPPARPTSMDENPAPYMQTVHVRVENGETRTIYNPSNEQILEMLQQTAQADAEVVRILHLPDDVPAEYLWVTQGGDDASSKETRWVFTPEEFEEQVSQEKQAGTGHLVPGPKLPTGEIVLIG